MQPAGDLSGYLAAPCGRYLAGRNWIHFCADARLCGLILWGRPDPDDVRAMVAALSVELPETTPHHWAFDDARRLDQVDPAAFQVFTEFFAAQNERFALNVDRQAVVRPTGLAGAVVAGLFHLVVPIGETRLFPAPLPALEWLERPDAPALVEALDGIYEAVAGVPPVVRAVRDVLAANRGRVSLRQMCRTLGLSERSLQDQLQRAGTSLRRETNDARVRAACVLLEDSDAKLGEIALDVGCASLQHFSTLFRKVTGTTPTEYRSSKRSART